MKKISLMLAMAGLAWTIQPANAQTTDTAKNKIEIKKKVKTGAHGRQVTKIKMESKGTAAAVSTAADGVTGRVPAPAPVTVTPPTVTVTPPPVMVTPPPQPATPTIVVIHDDKPVAPTPTSTSVTTTTTETQPVATTTSTRKTTTAHVTSARAKKGTAHVYRRVYKKTPAAAASTKVTTTTTVKKTE
jgi:hypothetical protein